MAFLDGLGLLALGSRTRALSERLHAVADAVYSRRGLKLQARSFALLRLLHDQGPKTVGEIAEAVGQTHSAVSQQADRLVRQGWLRVTRDASDRRRRVLQLTDAATAELHAARPAWRAIVDELHARCNAAGIDLLPTLAAFEGVLAGPIEDAIAERAARVGDAAVRIEPFRPALREHFHRLNVAWLQRWFRVEPVDEDVLGDPERTIIAPGGAILFALVGERVVGTCALRHGGDGVYELTRMGVDESRQGLGIGRRLLEATVDEFRRLGGRELFLESNSKLGPSLRLYETAGFEHQPGRRPGSHYARSDVYMIWREPGAQVDNARTERRRGTPAPA